MPTGLAELERAFHNFTASLVDDYTSTLGKRRFQSKVFNDPVWRTISSRPIEVVFIDSPLLQRLRRIRQLGVAHWVYPGATHTRFEHSLGAAHQVSCLINSINKSFNGGEDFISEPFVNLLRLTALCHDVGHGVMSHVSENAFRRELDFESLILEFAQLHKVEKPKLSEIATFYMLGSRSFLTLFEKAKRITNDYEFPDKTTSLMREAVIGKKISDEIPLLHELISGPFDADKLDYMNRDAYMSGVPVITDIPRITHKIRAIKIPVADLPDELAQRVRGALPSYTITGIALSGGRTLDELLLGRTLLFDKIYRHQKVRSAEGMVGSILKLLTELLPDSGGLPVSYLLDDDELTRLTQATIRGLGVQKLTSKQELLRTVVDISQRLCARNLYVRAFAFAQHMPLDPYRKAVTQRTGLLRLCKDARDLVESIILTKKLVSETREILVRLGSPALRRLFPSRKLRWYIHVSPPELPTTGNEIARAFLITESGKPVRFKDESAEARGWTDAYLLTNDIGYVFCPSELSRYVHLAAERVFSVKYGVRIPHSMRDYAKHDPERLDKDRRSLLSKGYYRNSPWHLRPRPERLSKADVSKKVADITQELSQFSAPAAKNDDEGKIELTQQRVFDWLQQFESDDMVDAALRMLQEVRLIGRQENTAALRDFLDTNPNFKGGFVCPLGEEKDSGAISAYLAADIDNRYKMTVGSLRQALRAKTPIVFVDDFIGSGNQAVTIFETLLNKKLSHQLNENRQLVLNDREKTQLARVPLAAVFSAGLDNGAKWLEKRCTELKLKVKISRHMVQSSLPDIKTKVNFASETQRRRFLKMCGKIGEELLRTTSNKPRAWRRERALGYGNLGLLVVFPFNVPAHSMTCLWSEGKYKGNQWLPLLPRRKKV